nr:MAG TPA: hypothetical protein [Bacteriophage sp.]
MHQPERDFWKTMTPRRLLVTLCCQMQRTPQKARGSLHDYLNGGGS